MASVLVVDDDPDQLELRRLILEHGGHRVWAAGGREAAVELFAKVRPAVVLMDWCLPRPEDGLALINALRRQVPAVRIVVLSGAAGNIDQTPLRSLADRWVRKPVQSEELLALIEKLTCDTMGA